MTFDNLNLHPKILKALHEAGYTEPTKIQSKAIPKINRGFDIRASAQTGTGKTAAFLLPALNRLTVPSKKPGKGPRILVLVPTRELAMQISSQAIKYSKYLSRVTTLCIVGGVPYPVQSRKLSRPHEILIATPGRLIDFIQRGKINFSRLEMLILDEADRMLDMGFVQPVEDIVSETPDDRQTLLFSATMQKEVIKLSERLMTNPMEIVVHGEKEKHENIQQKLFHVDHLGHKNRILNHILSQDDVEYAIVFTSTKRHADQLVDELRDEDFRAAALHGDMNQRQRTRTINQLREGKVRVLVATDVAARGIDVQFITHVINFDLPQCAEDYVHRIGRTGRAGATGTALSFVSGRDDGMLQRIQAYTGQSIEVSEIAGLEPRPRQQRSSGSRSGFSRSSGGGGGYRSRKPGYSGSRSNGPRSSKPRFSDSSRSDRPSRSRDGDFKRSSRGPRPEGAPKKRFRSGSKSAGWQVCPARKASA